MTPNGCPLCGTPNHSCGQPFSGTPVDLPARTENVMSGGVRRYRVNVNGTDTVLKLNSEDAKRYKDAVPFTPAPNAESDSGATEAEAEVAEGKTPDTKAVSAPNKSRSVSNKGGRSGGARNN